MIRLKTFLFLLSCLASSSQGFSQKVVVNIFMADKKDNPKSDTIYYDFSRKLSWADFQGKPDYNHFGGAVTGSGFAFNSETDFDEDKVEINIAVYAYFSKRNSWKKPDASPEYHLLHEQHHFDITRLGAERLVEELQKAPFTKSNYNTLTNAIFDKVYRENTALQKQYDLETKNSIDVKKQLEWNDRITTAIDSIRNREAQ